MAKISLSGAGSQFIRNFEGFSAKPYRDSGGVATVGWGTTITTAEVTQYSEGITEEKALELFENAVTRTENLLLDLPLGELLQHQQDAVISLVFNIGVAAFTKSSIYKEIVNREIDLSRWLVFTHDAKGHQLLGLLKRRRAELKLFVYGDYGLAPKP